MPDSTRAISVSRTWPGPSPTPTSAPQRRKTSAAASTTPGCVVTCGAAKRRLDEVRLQQDSPPADPILVKAHGRQPGRDSLGQRAVVALVSGEKDGRLGRVRLPQQRITQRGRGRHARADEHLAPVELEQESVIGGNHVERCIFFRFLRRQDQ